MGVTISPTIHDLRKRLDELGFDATPQGHAEFWDGLSSSGTVTVLIHPDGSIHVAKQPVDSARKPCFAMFTVFDGAIIQLVESWKR